MRNLWKLTLITAIAQIYNCFYIRTDNIRTDNIRTDYIRTDNIRTDNIRTDNICLLSCTSFLSVWHFRFYSLPVFVQRPFKTLLRHTGVAFSSSVWL
jgi:hypothetical protein